MKDERIKGLVLQIMNNMALHRESQEIIKVIMTTINCRNGPGNVSRIYGPRLWFRKNQSRYCTKSISGVGLQGYNFFQNIVNHIFSNY